MTLFMGDAAKTESKRMRARRAIPIVGMCENCGKAPAVDRHHKDGDTGNNTRSNILLACRLCHMTLDGRRDALIERIRTSPQNQPQAAKACSNCTKPSKPLRRGRCDACRHYFAANGVERPSWRWEGA